jgi:transposase
MNIRQNCIFSFEDALKMQPKSRLEKIIDTLDLQPVLAILNTPDKRKGGPTPYPGAAMLNAMIAMRLTNMTTFTSLVERLTYDPYLRYVCGFEPFGTAPSISCFSRFYAKLAESGCWKHCFRYWLNKRRVWAFLILLP